MATKTVTIEKEELNPEQKVTVRSISNAQTGFRRHDNSGDVTIPPKGSVRLSRSEIMAQVQGGINWLLLGTDGAGSHATLYVEDAATRRELGFDSEDGKVKQVHLTESAVKELFSKNQREFEKAFPDVIVTEDEKQAVMEIIRTLGENDYRKIKFAEQYTGHKF